MRPLSIPVTSHSRESGNPVKREHIFNWTPAFAGVTEVLLVRVVVRGVL
jgi:hypothetical protein